MNQQFPISAPGESTHTLTVDGRERRYILYAPSGYDGTRPWPVVLAVHGATSNPRLMQKFTALDAKADQAGFLLVYPAGTGNTETDLTWNGGACCGYAVRNNVDDVGYFRALLEHLGQTANVDASRVYVAGMSNGAHMTYRLASEMAEKIAAIACVAGPMAIAECRPSRPMPVLHIHGTHDEFAPFEGGFGPRSVYRAEVPSVPWTIEQWLRANACPIEPSETTLPDVVGDGTTIVQQTYAPGKDGVEVILMVVQDGGHTWPGRPPLPAQLGKSSMNMNANDVIWDFFQRWTRQ